MFFKNSLLKLSLAVLVIFVFALTSCVRENAEVVPPQLNDNKIPAKTQVSLGSNFTATYSSKYYNDNYLNNSITGNLIQAKETELNQLAAAYNITNEYATTVAITFMTNSSVNNN